MKRPMLFIASIAILISVLSRNSCVAAVVSLIMLTVFAVVFFVLCRRKTAAISFLLLTLCCLSVLNTYLKIELYENLDSEKITITAVATENSDIGENVGRVSVRAYAEGLPSGGKIMLLHNNSRVILAGESFKCTVELEGLQESEFKLYNYSNGYFCSAWLEEYHESTVTNRFYCFLQRVRDYVTETLFSGMSFDTAAVTNAVLTGDDDYMSDELVEKSKLTGVNHIMVVSGQHLTVLVLAIFGIIDRFIYNRFARFAVSTTVVIFITAVCGFSLSIVRAAIMFLIAAAAPLFFRRPDTLSALASAVFVILVSNPFAIFNLGFQLSVLATFGIVVFANFATVRTRRFFKKQGLGVLCPVAEIAIVTVSATITTMPVLIYNFGFVSRYAVLTNLIITYPVTAVLMLSVLAVMLGFLQPIKDFALHLCSVCADFVVRAINQVAELGNLTVDFNSDFERISATILSVCLIILLLLAITACKRRENLLQLESIKIERGVPVCR